MPENIKSLGVPIEPHDALAAGATRPLSIRHRYPSCLHHLSLSTSISQTIFMAEGGCFHKSSAPSATGALQAQPTPPLSASKSASDAPYVPPHQKWDQISSLRFTALMDGDTWYLISYTWYEKWKAACNPASNTHGRGADEQLEPVDNSDIVDADGELIPALSEGMREVFSVSQWTMNLFAQWYVLIYSHHSILFTPRRSQVRSSKVSHQWQGHLRGRIFRKAHRILSIQDKDLPHVKDKTILLLERADSYYPYLEGGTCLRAPRARIGEVGEHHPRTVLACAGQPP